MIPSKSIVLTPKAMTLSATELKSQTKELASRQNVVDVTSLDTGKTSITPIYAGKVIDFKPIPSKITITVENANVAGGDLEIKIFNNDTFEALPAGVTVSNSTGFNGKLFNKLIQSINNGDGLLVYGFNVTGYDSTGVKSDAVLNEAALEARYYNGYNSSFIPAQIDISGAERNTQFKDGLLTVKVQMMLTWLMQLKMNLGQQEKLQFVFFTQPIQD